VQTVVGLPSLGTSPVKARISNPFLAGPELKRTQCGNSQQLRRTLVVSAKQDTNTPLVSPIPPMSTSTFTCTESIRMTGCALFIFVNLDALR
jgi:hypothetical protein